MNRIDPYVNAKCILTAADKLLRPRRGLASTRVKNALALLIQADESLKSVSGGAVAAVSECAELLLTFLPSPETWPEDLPRPA